MKTSQKALLSAVGAVALGIIFIVAYIRIVAGSSYAEDGGEVLHDLGDRTTKTIDVRDFHGVVVRGGWDIVVKQGENWNVKITYPENMEKYLDIEVEDEHLVLGLHNVRSGKRDKELHLKAELTMPRLEYLEVAGAADLEFKGFSGENLHIMLAGAANIEGYRSDFEKLELRLNGAGRVDLEEVEVHDAEVSLAGAGDVQLNMTGGVLSGSLAGVGSIRYHGTIAENRVGVFGVGGVKKM